MGSSAATSIDNTRRTVDWMPKIVLRRGNSTHSPRSQFLDQSCAELLLMRRAQLSPARSEIKDVDCGLALGFDQSYFDIAAFPSELRADAVQQSELVLRDHFYQGALLRALIVYFDARFHLDLRHRAFLGSQAVAEHFSQIRLFQQHIVDAPLEPLPFRQI